MSLNKEFSYIIVFTNKKLNEQEDYDLNFKMMELFVSIKY